MQFPKYNAISNKRDFSTKNIVTDEKHNYFTALYNTVLYILGQNAGTMQGQEMNNALLTIRILLIATNKYCLIEQFCSLK